MKKQIIGGFFALVALFFTVVSCRKDVQTVTTETTQATSKVDAVKGDFHVENGILHFANSKALQDVIEQLRKIDISERRHFGENQGFYSYLNAYGQLLDKSAAAAEDDKEYDNLLRDNADIIEMNANGTFKMRLLTKSLASILNREGIVYVGKAACRFTDWGEAIASDGDIKRLKVVNSTTPSSGNITVFSQSTLPTRGPCGQVMNQAGIHSTTGSGAWGDFYCAVDAYRVPSLNEDGFQIFENGKFLWDYVSSTYSIGTPWRRNWRVRSVTFRSNNRLTLNQSLSSTDNLYPGSFLNPCLFGDNTSYTNIWTAIDYNGSGCVLFRVPEPTSGQALYATYLSAYNKYEMYADGVKIDLTCQ